MSGLRAPHLGPIVGHTTTSTATLWIRAGDTDDHQAQLANDRRTLGVVAVIAADGVPIAEPAVYYFRLRREYDRTGIFVLGSDGGIQNGKVFALQADTLYTVRTATLTLDDPWSNDADVPDPILAQRLPNAAVWLDAIKQLASSECEACFRTFPNANSFSQQSLSQAASLQTSPQPFAFLLGSCRYPGILWRGIKHSDQIFAAMEQQVRADAENPARLVLMVGDQIYADKFNRNLPIGCAETFEEFQQRYHDAFGSRHMRSLMQRVPHYMILDDHEIEDNWSQDRYDTERRLYTNAMQAYSSYQWVHGPRNFGERLHYSFDCGGFPFFVMDARTQRFMGSAGLPLDRHDTLADNHMLGRPSATEFSQLSQLLLWLYQQDRNVPKFIVSSSVFVPNPMDVRSGKNPSVKALEDCDSWPAFPETRKALLQCIVENNIQNVVFLSGDIHCSNVASLHFVDNQGVDLGITAFSITSSALYWPFCFASGDPAGYVHDSRDATQFDPFVTEQFTLHYQAFNFTQQDNFCRVEVDSYKQCLRVSAYDYNGKLIEEEKPGAGWNPLKPWNTANVKVPITAELNFSRW